MIGVEVKGTDGGNMCETTRPYSYSWKASSNEFNTSYVDSDGTRLMGTFSGGVLIKGMTIWPEGEGMALVNHFHSGPFGLIMIFPSDMFAR